MTPIICIYHANCLDGFASAWVVRKKFPNATFYPANYQEDPPDVTGADVIIVDFSYKRPVLLEMAKSAKGILILDHHKTAEADLVDLPENVEAIFDMDRSGAMLAWIYFFPGHPAPPVLLRVEDRDLWKFSFPDTEEVTSSLSSYPQEFRIWDTLMNTDISELENEGAAIKRTRDKYIEEIIKSSTTYMNIAGCRVPAVNAPHQFASETGNILAAGELFAACWYFGKGAVNFSLRSAPDGIDVSEIAKIFGGGGHIHAAGFKVTFEEFRSGFLE